MAQIQHKALKTRPPARYSEATLLGAMEGAGKLIDDDELREAMKRITRFVKKLRAERKRRKQ